ncbi:MAG: hypothetical protein ABSH20_09535 [Tepidisphaeraceae bacterium]|jgi:hypothetical protein
MDPADDLPRVVPCPQCGGQVQTTPSDRPQVLDCPHCSQPFVLPAAGGQLAVAQIPGQETFVTDDMPTPHNEDDLDGARIRRVAMLKRSAYRSRSYCVIIAIGCLAGAGQCIWNVVAAVRSFGRYDGTATAYGVIGMWMAATAGCVYLGNRFYRRAGKYTREAEATSLDHPATPPDFTALSDGSQRWKNLEQDDEEEPGQKEE